MPIDEFGREIPRAAGAPDDYPPRPGNNGPRGRSRSPSHYYDRPFHGPGGPGPRGRSRSYSPPNSNPRPGGGPGGGGPGGPGGGGEGFRKRRRSYTPSRSPSPGPRDRIPRRRRRSRSRSYSPPRGGGGNGLGGPPGGGGGGGGGPGPNSRFVNPPRRRRDVHAHPSERYAKFPMLCEYLWKRMEDANEKDTTTTAVVKTEDGVTETEMEAEPPVTTPDPTALALELTEQTARYTTYRKKYCLDYVRQFFNEHLDDEWFRQRYSPLGISTLTLRHRDRSASEAKIFKRELGDGNHSKMLTSFMQGVRLGVGRKLQGGNGGGNGSSSSGSVVPKSHGMSGTPLKILDIPSHVTDDQLIQALMLHVTSSVKKKDGPIVRLSSTTVGGDLEEYEAIVDGGEEGGNGRKHEEKNRKYYCNHLSRTAFAIFATPEDKDDFLENLAKANRSSGTNNNNPNSNIKVTDIPPELELDVDCTDPYGRVDIDYDGRGGAPAPSEETKAPSAGGGGGSGGPGPNGTDPKGEKGPPQAPKRPRKRCVVFVINENFMKKQHVAVLSTSVLSRNRIERDKNAALKIASAFDAASNRDQRIIRYLYTNDDDDLLVLKESKVVGLLKVKSKGT